MQLPEPLGADQGRRLMEMPVQPKESGLTTQKGGQQDSAAIPHQWRKLKKQ